MPTTYVWPYNENWMSRAWETFQLTEFDHSRWWMMGKKCSVSYTIHFRPTMAQKIWLSVVYMFMQRYYLSTNQDPDPGTLEWFKFKKILISFLGMQWEVDWCCLTPFMKKNQNWCKNGRSTSQAVLVQAALGSRAACTRTAWLVDPPFFNEF